MSAHDESTSPAVCPNGHAMDEGYFNCPCCGAFRPSAAQRETDAAAVKMMRGLGIPAAEVAEWLADAQRRRSVR